MTPPKTISDMLKQTTPIIVVCYRNNRQCAFYGGEWHVWSTEGKLPTIYRGKSEAEAVKAMMVRL